MSTNTPATATLIGKVKSEAKRLSRLLGIQHAAALEVAAQAQGFRNWYQLQQSRGAPPELLEVDPALPEGFDNTPNEQRSKADLDRWWDRPFAVTRDDGKLEVRCLDGGAWDRATFYGIADSPNAAGDLARQSLERWRRSRARPMLLLDDPHPLIVVMPQRPDQQMQVLRTCRDTEEARQILQALRAV